MWVYQAVTNVGIQVLLLMALGYVFARFRILEQAKFLPQSNLMVLMLALPAFNLYLMGIKLDLQSPEPWKSLAAFLVWVFAVQASILLYTWRCCGGDAGEAAVINMVLLMDNYAITGLLALNATLGTKWGPLALLMAMGFFLVIFPFSLAAFEWEKWAVQQHIEATAAAAALDIEAATAAAAAAEEEEAHASDGAGAPGGAGGGGADAGTCTAALGDEESIFGEDVNGTKPPAAPSSGSAEPLLLTGPRSAGAAPAAAAAASVAGPQRLRPSQVSRQPAAAPGGGGGADAMALALQGLPARGDIGPPAGVSVSNAAGVVAEPAVTTAEATRDVAVKPADEALSKEGQGGGFPHEGRYCWWSNAEYRPAHPLLGEGAEVSHEPGAHPPAPGPAPTPAPGAAPTSPAKSIWIPWRRRSQKQQPQAHGSLEGPLRGSYVPPTLIDDEEEEEAEEEAAGGGALSAGASPKRGSPQRAAAHTALAFPRSTGSDWPSPSAGAEPRSAGRGAGGSLLRPPTTAPSSARRRAFTTGVGSAAPGSGAVSPARQHSTMLPVLFDRLADAGSGQLPAGLFGDMPQQHVSPGAILGGSLPVSGALQRQVAEKPIGLQDLEFALTHQLSGCTAHELARVSRGYTAAAAAAAAAAASSDANMRRMLLAAAGGAGGALPRRQTQVYTRTEEPAGAGQVGRAMTAAGLGSAPSAPRPVPRGGKSRMQPATMPGAAAVTSPFAAAAGTPIPSSYPGGASPPDGGPAVGLGLAPSAPVSTLSPPRLQPAGMRPATSEDLRLGGERLAALPQHITSVGTPTPAALNSLESYDSMALSPPPPVLPTSFAARSLPSSAAPPSPALPPAPGRFLDISPTFSVRGPGAEMGSFSLAMAALPPAAADAEPSDGLMPSCPTFTARQGIAAAVPWAADTVQEEGEAGEGSLESVAPAQGGGPDGGKLSSMSTPMFSFGRSPQAVRSVELAASAAVAGGRGGGGGGGGVPALSRRNLASMSATTPRVGDMRRVDRALLAAAINSARKRRPGDATPGARGDLLDSDTTNIFMRLATAASALDTAVHEGEDAADRRLVREATAEALRRHGGLVGAFRAFVSGHPQLWHIIHTLARNPMIWTMFIAMAVSVSGLRVFLDPASPRYEPAVGWIAGALSWINGLVVPLSIFSNGAWMYGKPLLAKGELTKFLVLLAIKLGVLPLVMAGCAILVQLDDQNVAAMTVLTLSPAAAASFVLSVQYGRGVELVSLTNIVGNVFLTPLLIMWLKILTAIHIDYHLHEDV